MAVRLRLKRTGRKNRPFFRLCAFDSRTRRDGRSIEELGHYDPLVALEEKKYSLDHERIRYWLGVGAKPTETVQSILLKNGIEVPGVGKQRAATAEEKAAREQEREAKRQKREITLQRKAIEKEVSASPMTKKEQREAKRAGGR